MLILPPSEFWVLFKSINGAFSVCESLALMQIASKAPQGTYLELGTHKGKSAISAVVQLQDGEFHLVDPIFEDKDLGVRVANMVSMVTISNVVCTPVADSSINVIPDFDKLAYVFIDSGDHQELPMQEVKMLQDRMVSGGIIAMHDFNSQFIQVTDAYNCLLSTGKFEEISIPWEEIKKYVGENNLEHGNDSWHHTEIEFPCFVGALKRK